MSTRKTAEVRGALPDPKLDEKLADAFGAQQAPNGASTLPVEVMDADPPAVPFAGPMIYTLVARVMAEVSHVSKRGVYQQGETRYNFRGIDAVVNALGPALRKHGVIPVPTLETISYRDTFTTSKKPTREVTVQVHYDFYAPDGSSVRVTVPGESLDQSDKGTAKAMSVAYRIALLQLFALPTDEPDPDASYHTRDGAGAMPPATVELVKTAAWPATGLDALPVLWAVVMEHAAAERAIPGGAGTWAELFANRYAAEIARVDTWSAGKALLAHMEAAGVLGWRYGETTLSGELVARAGYLKERAAKSQEHCLTQIAQATTVAELETALGCVDAQVETNAFPPEVAAELRVVAEDKRTAIGRTEAQQSIDAFVGRAAAALTAGEGLDAEERAVKIMGAIEDLLTGAFSGDPASNHGERGFQEVADTITKAEHRDGTLKATDANVLRHLLSDHVELAGIEPGTFGLRRS